MSELDTTQVEVCAKPIFIIGSPRSGTSGLAWSLAQHSRLWTSAESDILYALFGMGHFEQAYRKVVQRERARSSWLTKEDVEREELLAFIGLGFDALFTSRSGGRRWIDQSPTYTLIVELLADMFPGAFFVHMLRDGRQVVSSMMDSGFETRWASSFVDACREWSRYVERAMSFCTSRPERAMTVRMDRLSESPEREFARLLAWMGLEYEDAPAAFFSSKRINSSYDSLNALNKPRTGLEVWEGWTEEERLLFREHAGMTLLRCDLAGETELAVVGARTPEL